METKAALLFGLMACVLTGGCGTAVNVSGVKLNPPGRVVPAPPPEGEFRPHGTIQPLWQPYSEEEQKELFGGLRKDCDIIYYSCTTLEHYRVDPIWALADMPFSAVGDVVTLPYLLAHKFGKLRKGSKESEAPAPSAALTPLPNDRFTYSSTKSYPRTALPASPRTPSPVAGDY